MYTFENPLHARLQVLKLFFFIAEASTLLLLLLLALRLGYSDKTASLLVVVFSFHPVVLKEVYNSLHIDIVPMCITLLATLLLLHRRWMWSFFILGLSLACKLYSVVLVPLFLLYAYHHLKSEQDPNPQPSATTSSPRAPAIAKALLCLGLLLLTVVAVYFPFYLRRTR